MSLHLDLLVDSRWHLAWWWVVLSRGYCVIWGLLVNRASIVRGCSLWKEVVLIWRCLKMLTVYTLLGTRDLNLDIWFTIITHSWRLSIVLAWIEEILLSSTKLVHRRRATNKINLLSRSASCRSSPSIGCAVSVPFNTFDQFSRLRIHLGKWIDCVILSSSSRPTSLATVLRNTSH